MTYMLTQLGGCDDKVSQQPITKYNVQERRVLLEVAKTESDLDLVDLGYVECIVGSDTGFSVRSYGNPAKAA
jgi:hypothetical protein